MTAHFEYQQTLDRYTWIVNRKMELEHQIRINENDLEVLALLRSEYRQLTDEADKIYTENYQLFNEVKPY